jgi:phosphohistidine phosphatase SixA
MARTLASYMQTHAIKPSLVLCSSLSRVAELLKLLTPALGANVRIVQNSWIQKATTQELFAYLQSTDETTESMMLIVRRRELEKIALRLTGDSQKTKTQFDTVLPPWLGYNRVRMRSLAGN